MLRAIRSILILLSPALLFLALTANADSLGHQMLQVHFAREALKQQPPTTDAIDGAVKAVLMEEEVKDSIEPVAKPPELSVVRPKARPDVLAANVSRVERLLAATADSSISRPPRVKIDLSSEDCLAIANYHEARGEGIRGQIAVSSVILQRAAVPGRWGSTPCAVVRPIMFEFMITKTTFPPIEDLKAWKVAKVIAREALRTGPLPQMRNADHYHAHRVSPRWRKAMPQVAVIGDHIFYADPLSRM